VCFDGDYCMEEQMRTGINASPTSSKPINSRIELALGISGPKKAKITLPFH